MVTDTSSTTGGGGKSRPSPPLRYGEKFEELCGYYMSLGMSYHDYWDGDNLMPKFYRQKHEYDKERRNYELWLQGAYLYEAVLDASPALNPLSKKNKPFPYRSTPIPITEGESKYKKEMEKKKKLENGKQAMRAMMANFNKQFQEKMKKGGEVDDGS